MGKWKYYKKYKNVGCSRNRHNKYLIILLLLQLKSNKITKNIVRVIKNN